MRMPFFFSIGIRRLKKIFHSAAGCLLIGGVFLCGISHGSDQSGLKAPFHPGERFRFELRWGVVPAGEAVLEVRPMKTIDGVPSHHFVLTTRTNEFIDIFYKVRQRIDAYADLDVRHSLLYQDLHTYNKKRKSVTVMFDWKNAEAQHMGSGKKKKPISIKPGTFDPLSIFYYARGLDLKVGETFERPVTDGKKCVVGYAKVLRREWIETALGAFDTYLIAPDLRDVGGVFKKSKHAKIELWVTADNRKIPVRLKSKVAVGSFTGDLIAYE
jgi:hypothetical protein